MPNVRIPHKMCSTCIYKPGNESLLADVRKRWEKGGHQQCHAHIIAGERRYDAAGVDRDVWCRGFWENEVTAPVKAWVSNIPGFLEIVKFTPRKRRRSRAISE